MVRNSENHSPFVFLHLRKTGGTSIRQWILNRFPATASLSGAHLKSRSSVDPNGYDLVMGHFDFGYLKKFHVAPRTMTMLRDPIERAISAYHYYRPATRFFITPDQPAWRNAALEKYASLVPRCDMDTLIRDAPEVADAVIGNEQTRYLAGMPDPATPAPPDVTLERAKRNLLSCEFVGITDRSADTVDMVCRRMGWPAGTTESRHDNRNSDRPRTADVDAKVRAALEHLLSMDIALYRFAEELFERRYRKVRDDCPLAELPADGYPAAADFTFDQPIYGTGWYERESLNDVFFCWSGPGRKSTLTLALKSEGEHGLEIHIQTVLDPALLSHATVRINNCPVEIATDEGATRFIGRVSAQIIALKRGHVHMELEVERTIQPCDIAASSDRRSLGIAVSCVRLLPLR